MSTPEPPPAQPAAPPPAEQRRRFRPSPTVALLVLSGIALLVVGGVAGALLFSRSGHDGPTRPGVVRLDERGPGPFGHGGSGAGRGFDRGPGPDAMGPRGRVAAGPVVFGTVVSSANGTLVITPDGAAQRTLRTDDRTRVAGQGIRSLTDLKADQRVAVSVTGTGDAATAVAVRVVEAHLMGTVTAVAGDTATVASADGLVVTVNTAAASPKPAVGDTVAVTGTASGTTITASTITVLPKA